jgi:tol-pal system protein YbgF
MQRANLLTTAAFGLVCAVVAAAPAFAQSDEDRRLDRLDKDLHELRAIVFQGRDTGQPVVVRPAGPDPDVTALGVRLDSLDASLRQITGQIEVLTHDIDEARQTASASRDQIGQLQGQLKDLTARVTKLEAGVAASAPPPPPPPPAGALSAAPDAAAAAPPSPPPSPSEAYKAARALFTAHDYAGAAQAFGAFVSQYPTHPQTPTAYYWLGESDTARQDYADAVPAYANALKGWPRTAWAADATVNLSRALAETSHTDQACAALGEFDRRYHATAGSVVKARAAEVRIRAKCS